MSARRAGLQKAAPYNGGPTIAPEPRGRFWLLAYVWGVIVDAVTVLLFSPVMILFVALSHFRRKPSRINADDPAEMMERAARGMRHISIIAICVFSTPALARDYTDCEKLEAMHTAAWWSAKELDPSKIIAEVNLYDELCRAEKARTAPTGTSAASGADEKTSPHIAK